MTIDYSLKWGSMINPYSNISTKSHNDVHLVKTAVIEFNIC